MPKLRKQRRLKKFNYGVNRKRLRNKLTSQGNIECDEIKRAWNNKKSLKYNLANMGLSYDPNKSVGPQKEPKDSNWTEEYHTDTFVPTKSTVVEDLEKEAKAPRERLLRLPNSQIHLLTYLLDKYGNDYQAMARDKKNYYQDTWKQIRNKIKVFKGIPEQYSKYLEERGPEKANERDISSEDEI